MTVAQSNRMQHLVDVLIEACRVYYRDVDESPIMSNKEYDDLFLELARLELRTGVVLHNSPTKNVGYSQNGGTDKAKHVAPILSLKNTKDIDDLQRFIGDRDGVLSWKLDGIGLVLYYFNGELERALTRGDGYVGKVVTDKALCMKNVPKKIAYKGTLVVRGEAVISLTRFEQVKQTSEGEKYGDNPRNVVAGIMNTIKPSKILLQNISFVAHTLVQILNLNWESNYNPSYKCLIDTRDSYSDKLLFLRHVGFEVVEHVTVYNYTLIFEIETLTSIAINDIDYPVDGLVLTVNDSVYGESLGSTAKYPKHSIAFKWQDEVKLTTVIGMKWSVSKTGLITPIAILKPVVIDNTTVSQANMHNLSFFEKFKMGVGDIVQVYKANKIVPEIAENMSRTGTLKHPEKCPVCGCDTEVVRTDKTAKLYCRNCARI